MKKSSTTPKVSVIMSVYNGEEFLREAIESILNQTYRNFEFIIIDDGSKDKSLKIIKSYKDARIVLVSRPNKGLVASLNEGIALSKGEYIARQDADDVSVLDRFEKEVKYMDKHPKTALVGSNYTIMDIKGNPLVTTNVFTHPNDLKLAQVTCNQYGHGSVMLRKSALDKVGGYDKSVGHVEDYDLWTRLSQTYDIANFVEPLYYYRKVESGVSMSNAELQVQQTFAVRDKSFQYFLKHRWSYKILSYTPSGYDYRKRKAVLYRDLAYLYRREDHLLGAICMMILAILLEPTRKKNYLCLEYVLYKPRFDRWVYEFL